ALEIFYQSVYMKKGRPGVLVKILCKKEDFSAIKNAILRYTSTIGFRFKEMERVKMERWEEKFDYEGEEVRVKISRFGDIEKIKPEFDDCVRISLKKGKNVSEIINEIIYNYRKRKDGLKKD
ncbi:MAG: nickel insertion protein, partial [Candidatus Aminicenantia bacterium]